MKIIKYGASWCGPCRATSVVLKESGLPFEEIDVDDAEEMVASKNIRSIPVVEFYDDSSKEPIFTHVGMLNRETLNSIINEHFNK